MTTAERFAMSDFFECEAICDDRGPHFGDDFDIKYLLERNLPPPAKPGRLRIEPAGILAHGQFVAESLGAFRRLLTVTMQAATSRFEQVERRISKTAERRAFSAVGDVVHATEEIFGEVRVKQSYDPEFPDDKYIVFVVRAKGTPRELVLLEKKWIEKVRKFAKNWESFRLLIRPAI